MVGDAALGEIVGADALVAHAGAHLTAAFAGDLVVDPGLLDLVELAGQHLHALLPVLDLAALLLAGDHNARGLVDQPDRRGGLVDMLAAGAAGAEHLHFDILGAQIHVHGLHFRQHRHGGRGGVDPSAGLGLRDPLDPVDAGLKFQPGIGPVAGDHKVRLLDAAQLGLVVVEQTHLPAPAVGVHGVHAEERVGEEGALLAADAAADFHDDVLVVVGVPGQQQDFQLLLQLLQVLFGLGKFLLAQIPHVLVQLAVQHFPEILGLLGGLDIAAIGADDGLQLPLLPQKLGRGLGVGVKIGLGRPFRHFVVAVFHRLEFIQHGYSLQ